FDRMDVPAEDRRTTQVASRLPAFIPSAQAASLAFQPRNTPKITMVSQIRLRATPQPTRWGVQVGTFATDKTAREAAASARRFAEGGEVRVEAISIHGRPAWRAQVGGLTAAEAQGACAAMTRKRAACFVLRPDP